MSDATALVKLVKQIASDAVQASDPVIIRYGKVEKVNPIRISLDQKLKLGKEHLILTQNVMEHTVEISPESGEKMGERSKVTVHNGLAAGDKVILLRLQGGQQYVVLDKIT